MITALRPLTGGLLALALLVSSAGAAETAACRTGRVQLAAMLDEIARLEQQRAALLDLGAPSSSSLATLLGADPGDEVATSRALADQAPAGPGGDLPGRPACPALREEWAQAIGERQWLRADVGRQQRHLLMLPAPVRHTLVRAWRLQQQLPPRPPGADPLRSPRELNGRLLALLPQLASPAEAAPALLTLWRDALRRPLPAVDARASPAERQLARFAALEVRHDLDMLRRWLWQEHRPAFQAALAAGRQDGVDLLTDEARAATVGWRWRLEEFRQDFREAREAVRPAVALTGLVARLAAGVLAFFGLTYLAQRSVRPLLAAGQVLARQSRRRPGLAMLAGLIGGLAPLLPWALLASGLAVLATAYEHLSLPLLLLLLPLAHAYVAFGLARTAGEWLPLHLAQQAGHYLGTDQTPVLMSRARRFALALALAWLVYDLAHSGAGPSLLQNVAASLAAGLTYLALGRLLAARRSDVVKALEAILPPALDPVAARLLGPGAFVWLVPALLPLLLLALAVRFTHNQLLGVDGYRKLAARWFKLMNQPVEEEAAVAGPLPPHYADWFQATPQADLPRIDTGLVSAMARPVARWLEARTEENSLLLTGERGIGKSTGIGQLLAALGEDHPDLLLRSAAVPARTVTPQAVMAMVVGLLDLPPNASLDDIIAGDEARAPTLVVLDNAEHLFLSQVGGLDGWRCVLDLVNAPLENVFWLLAMDAQAWAYLDNVFGRDYPLRNVLRVKPWTPGDLRSLILSRHHRSGFRLHYDTSLLSSRGPEAGNVRNAEQRCFSLLWDASRGNPLLALTLWLTSLRVAGDRVEVGLPAESPRPGGLERASTKHLFVYAAIVIHGGLTLAELVAVTQLAPSGVRFALKNGLDAGFLAPDDAGRFCLQPLWQHILSAYLARKNLLHE